MPYSLLIDVVVALLLVVTIGYAVRLNKRLGLLRRDKTELEKLAMTFAESTVRADESLGRLRSTADMMQKQIETAQGLHDDLAFLLDRGEKAADRLEDAVRESRGIDQRPSLPEKTGSVGSSGTAPSTAGQQVQAPEIEDINAGMTRPAPSVTSPVAPQENDKISAQSEAERELLKALRSGN